MLGVEPPSPGGADPDGVTARRLHGYREGFGAVGVDLAASTMIAGPATIDGGAAAIREAWKTGRRPTAILAMSDAIAIGAMQALRQLGLHVPDDVSVVGFDDIDLASHVDPPLTTVHQPIDRKGEEAVRALLAVIEGAGAVRVEHRRLDTRLVVRGIHGTGPAPRSHVTVDTPAWVRDAVFYQIFPDRFAGECPRAEARRAGTVGRAADRARLQGRGPARDRREARLSAGSRGHRDLPDADLPVGLEPPLSHVRLLPRGPAGRRRRRSPRVARRRPRSWDAGDPGWGLQSHRPGLLAVPSHPRERCSVAVSRLVPHRSRGPGGAPRIRRISAS